METQRIPRITQPGFHYHKYIQEIKKQKETTEEVKVIDEKAVEFPSYLGNQINFRV